MFFFRQWTIDSENLMTTRLILCLLSIAVGITQAAAQTLPKGDSFPEHIPSMRALVQRADVVIAARVSGPSARQTLKEAGDHDVYTVSVTEVFKGAVSKGDVRIGVPAQRVARGPQGLTFPKLGEAKEYVLFLVNDKRIGMNVLLYGENGVFELSSDGITTKGRASVASQQKGKSRDALLTELRSAAPGAR
jgi:hypothetical protein